MKIQEFCKAVRADVVRCIGSVGVGHIGGCLSIVEILAVLYKKHMRIDPKNPQMQGRDRLVCSKGHAGPAVYSVLANMGYFDRAELLTLNSAGTRLPSHCDMNKTIGIDMTTGSLGQGFSCAVGAAIGSKLKGDGAYIYAIIGDGESQEGQIWESAMYAAHKKLNNLIAFTDYNKYQIDGDVADVNGIAPLDKKWASFGWNVIVLDDGNDTSKINRALNRAKKCTDKPTMIIANTIKGKGISFIEEKKAANHSMTITPEMVAAALAEIGGN